MASNRTVARLLAMPSLMLLLLLCLLTSPASAHEHHDEDLPPGQVVTFDPVDSILWTHIFFMGLAFGVLFPTGMVTPPPFETVPDDSGSGVVEIAMACTRTGPWVCPRW